MDSSARRLKHYRVLSEVLRLMLCARTCGPLIRSVATAKKEDEHPLRYLWQLRTEARCKPKDSFRAWLLPSSAFG